MKASLPARFAPFLTTLGSLVLAGAVHAQEAAAAAAPEVTKRSLWAVLQDGGVVMIFPAWFFHLDGLDDY